MYVFDVVVGCFSKLFKNHRYPPNEKFYAVLFFIAGLSLRDLSERFYLTNASRESVRLWVHRFSILFKPSKSCRRLVAVDETVIKVNGCRAYVWAAIDLDSGEILAIYASRGRSMLNALAFMKRVLKACENKPLIVVDRGPWYPWALKRLGLNYLHEASGDRNRIERWFRELKDRAKSFYNNVNSKTVKSVEEIGKAIALIHNLLLRTNTKPMGKEV